MSREVNLGQIVPNIQVGATRTITPTESANVINVGTSLNPIFDFYIPKGDPGAINLLIVNELPLVGSEDTLYFVPKTDTEESDMYDEYVWINNDWELVGTKQITVDLSDYYTKQEVNNLIPTQLSELSGDSTHRVVTDVEKSTWNNKVDSSVTRSSHSGDFSSAITNNGNMVMLRSSYTDDGNTKNSALVLGSSGFSIVVDDNTFIEVDQNNNLLLKDVIDPVDDTDAVNKKYVDDLVGDIESILTILDVGGGV